MYLGIFLAILFPRLLQIIHRHAKIHPWTIPSTNLKGHPMLKNYRALRIYGFSRRVSLRMVFAAWRGDTALTNQIAFIKKHYPKG